ncbi:MAG: glycoside hydrolase family 88 protein [Solirubrobacterales bacterium]|nr:glycoside hydrolase family 88 protein [Solirubrobacterales bacterium]
MQIVGRLPVTAVAIERLPARAWAVSFDVRVTGASRVEAQLGYGGEPLTLAAHGHKLSVVLGHAGGYVLSRPRGWLGGGWWHVEATDTRLAVDGRLVAVPASSAATISFHALAGHPQVSALIATPSARHGLLLLHRLAELHARIPGGQFPEGATLRDHIVYASTYWTSGFWAGALWQAAAIAPQDGLFSRWALMATLDHFGQEQADTHDVGFMYGESSLAAWEALCETRSRRQAASCPRLKRSVLRAADELRALAASNPGAGTIPTDAASREADTIIDSLMNIAILPWASRITGKAVYARLAAHQAHTLARLLVRPDGSTAQAVTFDRATGRVLWIGTHQGLSDGSTWSRGEGWALYGFAQAAVELHDRGLLKVALGVAGFVASHLPRGAIPLWDYDAPAGAQVDVSAGVITAAGLFHLARACQVLAGVCSNRSGGWIRLGRRMLAAALGRASANPPLGLLRSQVLNEHGHGCWCNGAELIFGLAYALDALRMETTVSAQPGRGQRR